MRKRRPWVVLLMAITSGSVAAYLALQYLRDRGTPLIAAEPPKGRVVVAARDLPMGAVLRLDDLRLISWPADALPSGYASSPGEVVGRGLISAVRENEPLLTGKLADKEAGGGLPILIPEGFRAVSVKVDEVIGVAGFVLPSTRVDVLVTLGGRSGQGRSTTRVILQNIRTLAAGQSVQRDFEGKPQTVTVITLLVTPHQAEILTLAATEGRIQLALRNTLDTNEVETSGAGVSALLGGSGSGYARAGRPSGSSRGSQATVIETYKGGVRALITF